MDYYKEFSEAVYYTQWYIATSLETINEAGLARSTAQLATIRCVTADNHTIMVSSLNLAKSEVLRAKQLAHTVYALVHQMVLAFEKTDNIYKQIADSIHKDIAIFAGDNYENEKHKSLLLLLV